MRQKSVYLYIVARRGGIPVQDDIDLDGVGSAGGYQRAILPDANTRD
jgi:hypothetical protein